VGERGNTGSPKPLPQIGLTLTVAMNLMPQQEDRRDESYFGKSA
jgi:hypothetical protein